MIPLSSKISNENFGKTLDVNCENFVTSEKIILTTEAEVNVIRCVQIPLKKHLYDIFAKYRMSIMLQAGTVRVETN